MSIENTVWLCADFLDSTEPDRLREILGSSDERQVRDDMAALRYVADAIHQRVALLTEKYANEISAVSCEFGLDLHALGKSDAEALGIIVTPLPQLALEIAAFVNRILTDRLQARVLLQIQQHKKLRVIPGIAQILSQTYP